MIRDKAKDHDQRQRQRIMIRGKGKGSRSEARQRITIRGKAMNQQEYEILRAVYCDHISDIEGLSKATGHSDVPVNRAVRNLIQEGYLTSSMQLTARAKKEFVNNAPKNAIILAAGFGMRMVPINLTAPKGLLEVAGEPLIERLIKQLHRVGIQDITVIIGFMKEKFRYLTDRYGVNLVENDEFASKNNLYSLALAADRISNTYIIPSDIWCDSNPFSETEMYSWYMVSDIVENDSYVRADRNMKLHFIPKDSGGNAMIGIAYILEKDAAFIRGRIRELTRNKRHDDDFWEIVLYDHGKILLPGKMVHGSEVVEIDTYEQLRDLDGQSNQLRSDALDVIAKVFKTTTEQIVDIAVLKKGMTNRSFLFSVNDEKYIMRIPGEGTDQLIDRREEAQVYEAISGRGLCDDPAYINPENGYKITRFLEGVRTADPYNVRDLEQCMRKLRQFHEMQLKVGHTFDIFEKIEYYESLWQGQPSVYRDYIRTKANVLSLRGFIEAQPRQWCLTHIDAVPDNFLFCYKKPVPDDISPETAETQLIRSSSDSRTSGYEQELQLTDWEYAGMQDPHVDIAMFSIYSGYDKRQIDRLINIYFEGNCDPAVRAKIYCYVAACGLLWSNWCEYKRWLSIEFGEYSVSQYKYARNFYKHALKAIEACQNSDI